MKIDDMIKLMKAVSECSLTSFELEDGGVKLSLKREKELPQIVTVSAPAVAENVSGAVAIANTAPAAQTAAAPAPAAEPAPAIDSDKVITSPLVGTFYSAASPDDEPFVKEGDHVKKGQVLGLIEAMKLMNEIESEYDGVVEAVLVENESVVEYGQPLFRIR